MDVPMAIQHLSHLLLAVANKQRANVALTERVVLKAISTMCTRSTKVFDT
jgi:hypothetical protein